MDVDDADLPQVNGHEPGEVHEDLGEAMLALSEKQRAFVWALFEVPPGRGAYQRAAIRAGYGNGKSNIRTLNQLVTHSGGRRRSGRRIKRFHIATSDTARSLPCGLSMRLFSRLPTPITSKAASSF
jgi:hypothetical protein